MSRLAQVLRAGEAHRQSVRTDTLTMEDMDDDVIRSILDALARGAPNEACEAATKWCGLNTRNRRVCDEGSDGLWHELKVRVFGADVQDAKAGPGTGRRNFYALCKEDSAKRWMQGKNMQNVTPQFLFVLGEILADTKAGGKETSNGRVHLVMRMMQLFTFFPDEIKLPPEDGIIALCDAALLYSMLENGTEEEKDAALDLLGAYADNHSHDYDPPVEAPEDHRYGYVNAKVWLLRNIFVDGNLDRKMKVLKIWRDLLIPLPDAPVDDEKEIGSYASRMVADNILPLLVHTVTGEGANLVAADAELRDLCTHVLAYISLAIYRAAQL